MWEDLNYGVHDGAAAKYGASQLDGDVRTIGVDASVRHLVQAVERLGAS